MFERRLKIFLGILCGMTFVLMLRAAQVQVLETDQWRKAAADSMTRSSLIETVRGSILDVNGEVIARDEACVDACVDYRAITETPDAKWVLDRAADRLGIARTSPLAAEYAGARKGRRRELLLAECEAVRADVKRMWEVLAAKGGKTPEAMQEQRDAIVMRVNMRQKLLWYRNFKRSHERDQDRADGKPIGRDGKPLDEAFWQRWLADAGTTAADAPDVDKFAVVVSEQTAAHVILRAIDVGTQNDLGKALDRFPGLSLKPSTHRRYPFGHAFCHAMGRVTRVTQDDLLANADIDEETRQYLPNDLIGRAGVEALAERALRGSKGREEKVLGTERREVTPPARGKDVRLTVDVKLQSLLEEGFTAAELIDNKGVREVALLHGSVVVIDVKSSEVRALASYPTYDINRFDEDYQRLHADRINHPLLNRATMSQLQPGSTVKPLVGLAAATQGLAGVDEAIECTGYLVISGDRKPTGRCWVTTMFGEELGGAVAHHPVPSAAPHPTGFLTFGDALERSCNVYFETMAHRLGWEGLSTWYDRFGLGRPTGVGIPEARGRLPRDYRPLQRQERLYKTWFAGIGQDPVSATPIQMANAAATIARNGLWMRPRLISDDVSRALELPPPGPRASTVAGGQDARPGIPDRFDLNLNLQAVARAKEGMLRVVHGPAGTGKLILTGSEALKGLRICGKTGTAQAPKFSYRLFDEKTGKPILGPDGKQVVEHLEPSTRANPNPKAPWFRGTGKDGKDLSHAWYIGFAPADDPQVAFAVMVEYGGSGGHAAGAVARKTLEACIEMGYLKVP